MNPINILIVDDSEADVFLIREAFGQGKLVNTIENCKNGELALEYLNKYKSSLPDLILLDINMPKMNGFEFLKQVKSKYQFKHIPIIMLTSSDSDRDIYEAYKNQVSSYIRKPIELENLFEAIRQIENYWISLVKLPKKD